MPRTISTSAATLELADAGKVLVVTTGTDITVPADATVNFPIGTRVEIARTTGSPTLTGDIGFVGAIEVSIIPEPASLVLMGLGGLMLLWRRKA